MFPPTWKTPPWRNMDVNTVTQGDGRPGNASTQFPVSRQGVRPNSEMSSRVAWPGREPSMPREIS